MVPESEVDNFLAEIDEILTKYGEQKTANSTNMVMNEISALNNLKTFSGDEDNEYVVESSLKRSLSPNVDTTTFQGSKPKRAKNYIIVEGSVDSPLAETSNNLGEVDEDKIEYLTEYIGESRKATSKSKKHGKSVTIKSDDELSIHHDENDVSSSSPGPILIGPQPPPPEWSNDHVESDGDGSEKNSRFIGPVLPKDADAYLVNEDTPQPSIETSAEEIVRRSIIIRDAFKTITSKVSALGEREPTFLQILLIQLMTRVTDWESGALSLSYMETCVQHTEAQMVEYEKAIVPSGWLCHWNFERGAYFYENCSNASRQWDIPTVAAVPDNVTSLATDSCYVKPSNMEEGEIEDSDREETEHERVVRNVPKILIDAEDLLERLFDEAKTSNEAAFKPDSEVDVPEVPPILEETHQEDESEIASLSEVVAANELTPTPPTVTTPSTPPETEAIVDKGSPMVIEEDAEDSEKEPEPLPSTDIPSTSLPRRKRRPKSSLLVGYSSSEGESESEESESDNEKDTDEEDEEESDKESHSDSSSDEEVSKPKSDTILIGPQLPPGFHQVTSNESPSPKQLQSLIGIDVDSSDTDNELSEEETHTEDNPSLSQAPSLLDEALLEWEKMKETL